MGRMTLFAISLLWALLYQRSVHCESEAYLLAVVEDSQTSSLVMVTDGTEATFQTETSKPVNVPPRSMREQRIDANMKATENIENRSIPVNTSGSSIHLYVSSPYTRFSLLPVSALGRRYIVSSCSHNQRNDGFRSVLVIATYSQQTNVSVYFRLGPGRNISYKSTVYSNGDVLDVSLDAYQTLTLRSTSDLSGTEITSSQPIAVFTGLVSGGVIATYEQLIPSKHFADEFVVAVDNDVYTMQIVSYSDAPDSEIIFNNNTAVFMPADGVYVRTVKPNEFFSFTTTKPVMTTLCKKRFLNSSFVLVPPVSSYLKQTVIYNKDASTIKFFSIMDNTAVTVGYYLPTFEYIPVPLDKVIGRHHYVGTVQPIVDSSVFFASDIKFGVLCFGRNFAYNGGYSFPPLLFSDSGGDFVVPSVSNTGSFYVTFLTGETGAWIKTGVTKGWKEEGLPEPSESLNRGPFSSYTLRMSDVINSVKGSENQSVVVTSGDSSISIFAYLENSYFSLIPVSELGTGYIVSSFFLNPGYQFVLVIATHSQKVEVEVTLRLQGSVSYGGNTYGDGDTLRLGLPDYDTITITSPHDLTGTTVKSITQTVAVFTGVKNQRSGLSAFTQFLPVSHYGQEYVIAPNGDVWSSYDLQIVSDNNETQIMFDDGNIFDIGDRGALRMGMSDKAIYFISFHPVMATLHKRDLFNNSFLVLPPVSSYRNQNIISASKNFNIIIESDASDIQVRNLSQDSIPLTWTPVGNTRFKVGKPIVDDIKDYGRIYITSDTKFGLLVFDQNSAFNGGYNFSSHQDGACPRDTDYRGTIWQVTSFDTFGYAPCPKAYRGIANRKCSSYGKWEKADYSGCVKRVIKATADKILSLNSSQTEPSPDRLLTEVQNLAVATVSEEVELTSYDIETVVNVLPTVVSLDNRTGAGINVTESFIRVVSNIMRETTKPEWMFIQEQKDSRTFITLLDAVTAAGFVAATKVAQDGAPVVIAEENIVFEAGQVTPKDIHFPKIQRTNEDWNKNNVHGIDCRNSVSATLRKATLEQLNTTKTAHPYTAALYDTLGYLQAQEDNETKQNISANVPIISMFVDSKEEIDLNPPLEVIFRACVRRRRNPPDYRREQSEHEHEQQERYIQEPPPKECVRKKEDGYTIQWTTENTEVVTSNEKFTKCNSDKSGQIGGSFKKFLKILREFLAKYACLLPILAVIFKSSKGIYSSCKMKQLKRRLSDQPYRKFLLALVISVVIIASNAELIALVEKTDNRFTCWVVAGTLHFFFVVECFYFMVHAMDVFLPELLGIPCFLLLLLFPWVLSVALVAVAMFVVHTRESYLGENICWLSKESGAYFFLIIPAVAVPVIQLAALFKALRDRSCGCKEYGNKGTCGKMFSWIGDNKQLFEFAGGIALMSAQVFLSVFAEDDKSVMEIFFGVSTLAKGLLLAVTGLSSQDITENETRETSELTKISHITDGVENSENSKSPNGQPNDEENEDSCTPHQLTSGTEEQNGDIVTSDFTITNKGGNSSV